MSYMCTFFVTCHSEPGGGTVYLLKAATEAVGLSVTFKVGPWNELKQEPM